MMSALLMTILQWAWSTGDGEQFRIPYLYHKLQAMRFVKEQLANPGTAADEGTVAVIASLALVEVWPRPLRLLTRFYLGS